MFYLIPLLFHSGFSSAENGNAFTLWDKLGEIKQVLKFFMQLIQIAPLRKSPLPNHSYADRLL